MCSLLFVFLFFFFKQKTAYEMRISDWSSDVCSSDLGGLGRHFRRRHRLCRHLGDEFRRHAGTALEIRLSGGALPDGRGVRLPVLALQEERVVVGGHKESRHFPGQNLRANTGLIIYNTNQAAFSCITRVCGQTKGRPLWGMYFGRPAQAPPPMMRTYICGVG